MRYGELLAGLEVFTVEADRGDAEHHAALHFGRIEESLVGLVAGPPRDAVLVGPMEN